MSPAQPSLSLDDRVPPDEQGAFDPSLDWDIGTPPDEDYFDDPPSDWAAPPLDALEAALAPDLRPTLEAEIADLDRRIEENAIEMNTLDGTQHSERLAEDQAGLLEGLEALDKEQELPEQAPMLVGTRFLGQSEVDANGNLTGYTVQTINLYQDGNQQLTGRVLDVGHYADLEAAAESYQALQESVETGAITLQEVALLAEAMAEENGLDAHAWRDMSPHELANYEYHTAGVEGIERDMPSDALIADTTFAAQLFNAALPDPEAVEAQAALANEQALAALRGIGLEAPQGFDLSRDSFYGPERGERVVNGIFQADLDDPSRNCRPLFVSFTPGEEGLGFQAQAVEFGQVGSLDEARHDQENVQIALEKGGIEQALDAIQFIEALHLEPDLPEITAWSRDID